MGETKLLKSTGSTNYSLSTVDTITSLTIPLTFEKEIEETLTDFIGLCVELGIEITAKEEHTENQIRFCKGLDKLSELLISVRQMQIEVDRE